MLAETETDGTRTKQNILNPTTEYLAKIIEL